MKTVQSDVHKTGRQSNIALLRIICMIMIVAHHIGVHGSFPFATNTITPNRLWVQFLELGGKVGVDIFILISGYFLINAKAGKVSKTIKLWLQLFIYSVGIFLIFVLLQPEIFGVKSLIKSLLPVSYSTWWFASAYFVLYLIFPYLNIWLKAMDKKTYQRFLLLLTAIWCIFPTFLAAKWESNELLWFVYLYALAGYCRIHFDPTKIKAGVWFLAFGLLAAATFLCVVLFDVLGSRFAFFANRATYFYSMQKLPTLLMSVTLFFGFLNIDIKQSALINRVAAATFGVYLIHDHPLVRNVLWVDILKNPSYTDSALLIPYTFIEVAAIFAVCILVELLRAFLVDIIYDKLLAPVVRHAGVCGRKIAGSKTISKIKRFF